MFAVELSKLMINLYLVSNCRTIHGKSRYPGLNIWPRNESEKLAVRVPDGCLLVC